MSSTAKVLLNEIAALQDPLLSCNFRLVFDQVPAGALSIVSSFINSVTGYLWGTGRSFLGVDLAFTADNQDLLSLHCRSANIAATSIEPIIIEHKGHKSVYPGRRVQENSVTFEFLENDSAAVSNLIRYWMNEVRRMDTNKGKERSTSGYIGSAILLIFKQDGTYSSGYRFRNLWPTQVGEISFAGSNAEVVAVPVTFAYDVCYFDSNAATTLGIKFGEFIP